MATDDDTTTLSAGELVNEVLAVIFSDPNRTLRKFRHNCFCGEVAGLRIGAVLATQNPTYVNFALNKADFTRLIEAEVDGRVNGAWVVFAYVDGQKHTFKGAIRARELYEQIKSMGLETRDGRYGPFYVLPASLAPVTDDAPW